MLAGQTGDVRYCRHQQSLDPISYFAFFVNKRRYLMRRTGRSDSFFCMVLNVWLSPFLHFHFVHHFLFSSHTNWADDTMT